MDNITILKQLLNGYHLNNKELKKAKKIIELLNNEIQLRKGINEDNNKNKINRK